MNERIKELAEQARVQDRGYFIYQYDDHQSVEKAINLEKFAELIVKECCNVLQGEDIRYGGYGYNQGFLHKKIKEHFGVENDKL